MRHFRAIAQDLAALESNSKIRNESRLQGPEKTFLALDFAEFPDGGKVKRQVNAINYNQYYAKCVQNDIWK